ncbi:hypothetical protein [Streptomyces olivoreticuli]|uniref:hypothetical protein n=1 Tax=Streptomyces olivoreticuli TaxID=68246 RepID=UPI0013C370A2|nr:hypothetical protein [Streptomyces olivoreticuli]
MRQQDRQDCKEALREFFDIAAKHWNITCRMAEVKSKARRLALQSEMEEVDERLSAIRSGIDILSGASVMDAIARYVDALRVERDNAWNGRKVEKSVCDEPYVAAVECTRSLLRFADVAPNGVKRM